ncbi:hypothetical protein [Acinetobacter rudis]|uniref:Uncharacterized protein n=1 Tax=Acinetobacter rudis CIP 110305 TaxID=421052 RepID=S3NSU3_9GAMM|nr:hypothetical protein [Acinetobacter rudis]EPF77324.1 hypothetical protein F945_00990 [Acinetobacter rudis CIP 110305]
MNILTTRVLTSALFAVSAGVASTAFAAEADLQQAYKSTDVKSALINVCKTETSKGGKLTAAEVAKYCGCAIESDGKLTNAQKWQIQSTINQKKSPSTLAFVQQQNQALKTCFGPQLTTKLQTLTEAAMKAAQAK